MSEEKENNKEKHQFRNIYCGGCRQVKPCQLLARSVCCACAYQSSQRDYQAQQAQVQKYSNYPAVYSQERKENQERVQQLKLLKNYQGCKQCGSKEVDAYELYEENKLTCQPCRIKKEGRSSSPVSFLEQQKWYKRCWKIELGEWLTNNRLPINANCAKEWLKDKEHLNNCACLEQEIYQARQRAEEGVKDLANSLQEKQELLKGCRCQKSEKVRVADDDLTACEKCEKYVSVASKKRVIKNRNNPSFWGLKVQERVLCGECLEEKKGKMPPLQRAEFNRYRKAGRL